MSTSADGSPTLPGGRMMNAVSVGELLESFTVVVMLERLMMDDGQDVMMM